MAEPVIVKPLAPELSDDFFAFFDGPAFADNPKWASCFCFFPHCPKDEEWKSRTAPLNRAAMAARIGSGTQSGLLAYRSNRVVGWLSVDSREGQAHFMARLKWAGLPGDDAAKIAACTCFVIHPESRGTGVATALLTRACEHLKQRGFTAIEGFPIVDPNEQSNAEQHLGPLSLYEKAGFTQVGELDGVVKVMRKAL